MHLTSADARAAREGFHFVVMRGGTRVAYTTTAAEAKRECGKGCKVYPLARMRYAAQNPKAKAKVVAHDALGQVIKAGDAVEVLRGRHDGLSGVVRSVYDGYVEFPVGMMGRTVTVAAKDCLVKRSNPATKRTQLASLDRRIKAAERAGMPVAYLLEQRDLLARRKKANPSFNKWLDTFLEEKEIDLEEVLEVKGKQWGTNYIPVGIIVQVMKRAPKHEQEAIKTMLVKIDFRNAPVRPYLAHLGQAIARNPRRNPDWSAYGSAAAKGVHTAAKTVVPAVKRAGEMALVALKSLGRGLQSFAKGFGERHAEEMPRTAEEVQARIAKDAEEIKAAEQALHEEEKLQRKLHEEAERIRKAKEALEREKAKLEAQVLPALPAPLALPAPMQNPGLTKAGKRHLIQTMHKAGADTFRKKMRYVRKHMPHITDPAAFVGYVMQGEKR